jgi:hypothetical protein
MAAFGVNIHLIIGFSRIFFLLNEQIFVADHLKNTFVVFETP